jgi:hypothetical protein
LSALEDESLGVSSGALTGAETGYTAPQPAPAPAPTQVAIQHPLTSGLPMPSQETGFVIPGSATPSVPVRVTQAGGVARFSGASLRTEHGRPELPYHEVSLVLPPDADLASVQVRVDQVRPAALPGQFDVAPATPMIGDAPAPPPAGRQLVNGRDPSIYQTNAVYPANWTDTPKIERYHGYGIVRVPVNVVRYNPVTRTLVGLADAKLVVTANTSPTSRSSSSAPTGGRVERQLWQWTANADTALEAYRQTSARALPSSAPGYVIITTDTVRTTSTQLAAFADAKVGAGFAVELVTESGRWRRSGSQWSCTGPATATGCGGGFGGGTGDAAADRIRQWLVSHYVALNADHVLLIGDPDPANGAIPMKTATPGASPVPTDYYYADLSGDWDLDGDGRFGEFGVDDANGGLDQLAELSVGRIPFYGDLNGLDRILAKTIRYQSELGPTWRRHALLPMDPSDAQTLGYSLAEQLRNRVLTPNGFSSYRVYDGDFAAAPEFAPCDEPNVTQAWNEKDTGLTVWWTHGNSQGAADVMSSHGTRNLDDAHPSFTFQVSCSNAYPEDSNNLAFSLLNNGAIATVGATRVSYYHVGQTAFSASGASNADMGYGYAEALVRDGQSAGHAMRSVRSRMSVSAEHVLHNLLTFNLYGDPATTLTAGLAPSQPANLTTTTGDQRVTLRWRDVASAQRYEASYSTSANGPFTVINANVISPSYVVTGLRNGTPYYFQVKAIAGELASAGTVSSAATPALIDPATPASSFGDFIIEDVLPNGSPINTGTIYENWFAVNSALGIGYNGRFQIRSATLHVTLRDDGDAEAADLNGGGWSAGFSNWAWYEAGWGKCNWKRNMTVYRYDDSDALDFKLRDAAGQEQTRILGTRDYVDGPRLGSEKVGVSFGYCQDEYGKTFGYGAVAEHAIPLSEGQLDALRAGRLRFTMGSRWETTENKSYPSGAPDILRNGWVVRQRWTDAILERAYIKANAVKR